MRFIQFYVMNMESSCRVVEDDMYHYLKGEESYFWPWAGQSYK